ncbi:MAG TPA: O-antigen ligase family protein [Acetobacteraceae bacterium]|nr:O-antigen ligase family protein [Acetobacteraceae bacterium]
MVILAEQYREVASMRAAVLHSRPRSARTQRIGSWLSAVFSVETCFTLFLFSGRFKGLPELQGSPVDVTLLFLTTTWCLVAWNIISGRIKPLRPTLPFVMMILFCEYAVVSLFWSSLDPINLDKAARFILLTGSGFFVACLLASDEVRRKRLLGAVAWLSFALVLYYLHYRYILGIDLMSPEYSWVDRQTEGGDNYLEYGEHAAILFNVLLTLGALASWKQAVLAAIGSALPLAVLLSAGGRGPLALSAAAIVLLGLILFVRGQGFSRALGRLAGFVACLLVIGMIAYVSAGQDKDAELSGLHTVERYQAQLSGEDTYSMDLRADGRRFAFSQWLQKPVFGWGIGEFRVQDTLLRYPHNTLLEVLMELGLVGAYLYLGTIVPLVLQCWRMVRAPPTDWSDIAIVVLFITTLCWELTFAGYLADDRIFFAYAGMITGAGSTFGVFTVRR